jgi:hypothetical protein
MSSFKYGEEKRKRSCGSVGDVIKIAVALKEINGPRLCICRPIAEDADIRQGLNIIPSCGEFSWTFRICTPHKALYRVELGVKASWSVWLLGSKGAGALLTF